MEGWLGWGRRAAAPALEGAECCGADAAVRIPPARAPAAALDAAVGVAPTMSQPTQGMGPKTALEGLPARSERAVV